jgi:G patch domain-containing protein 1
MAEDANQGRDTLTYVKPSIDIFKAIFASDDEDDDEEEVPVPPPAPSKFVARAQETQPKDPYPVDEKPVDYNTFKPVFRRTEEERKDDEKEKAQRKKDKKDKKKRKGVLSFDVGDDEDDSARAKPKKKVKAKREEVTEEWVEKAPVVQAPAPEPPKPEASSEVPNPASSAPRLVRKGAADLW